MRALEASHRQHFTPAIEMEKGYKQTIYNMFIAL